MNLESNEGPPGQAGVAGIEGSKGLIVKNLEDDLEGVVTTGYGPESGSQSGSQSGFMNVLESIETDDPSVLPEAEARPSPAFGTPSHQNTVYCSPPTETSAGGLFKPSTSLQRWQPNPSCGSRPRSAVTQKEHFWSPA